MVSGAGPSVLVLGEHPTTLGAVRSVLAEHGGRLGDWQVHPLAVDRLGAVLVDGGTCVVGPASPSGVRGSASEPDGRVLRQ